LPGQLLQVGELVFRGWSTVETRRYTAARFGPVAIVITRSVRTWTPPVGARQGATAHCDNQPGYQMGATAARILIGRVGGDASAPPHAVLRTELKIRQSVGPPPAESEKTLSTRKASRNGAKRAGTAKQAG
jgi:hypothetical protein